MKKRIWLHPIWLVVFSLLASCTSEKDGEPVDIFCDFSFTSTSPINGSLNIESVSMNLSKMEIYNANKNWFFRRDLLDDLDHFTIYNNQPNEPIHLQLPAGVYDPLVFDLDFQEDEFEFDNQPDDDDETDDLGEYLQKAQPGILLIGTYQAGSETYNLILSVDDDFPRIRVNGHHDGTETIYLNTPFTADFNFNLDSWFNGIGATDIENAEKILLNGETYVFIYEGEKNDNLFDLIKDNIESSVSLTLTTN